MDEISKSKDFLNRGLSYTSFKYPTLKVSRFPLIKMLNNETATQVDSRPNKRKVTFTWLKIPVLAKTSCSLHQGGVMENIQKAFLISNLQCQTYGSYHKSDLVDRTSHFENEMGFFY